MPILQLMLILMVLLLGVRLHTRTYTAVYHVHTSDRFAVRYSMVGLSKFCAFLCVYQWLSVVITCLFFCSFFGFCTNIILSLQQWLQRFIQVQVQQGQRFQ